MSVRCYDDYFKKIGVLVDIPTAGGGTVTKANFCHEKWADYWMCQLPDGVESFTWWAIGYLMHLAQCEGLCDCGDQQCGKSLCGVQCGDLKGQCPDGYQCTEQGQCDETPCEPDCAIKECGDDGCGGSCGECPDGYYCSGNPWGVQWCKMDCEAACADPLACGKIGDCGCGPCPPGYTCDVGNTHKCIPNCDKLCEGKECGPAGVNGECSCGECTEEGFACVDGECAPDCAAACDGVDCGIVKQPIAGTWCYCGDCAVGNLCWNNVCTQAQCSPVCVGGECSPDGCTLDCENCPPDSLCSTAGSCCGPLTGEKLSAYQGLLANEVLSGILNLAAGETESLLQFVWELECNATQQWSEFDDISLMGIDFEVVRKIWLRRVAVALYNEVNEVYPWSIVPVPGNENGGDALAFTEDMAEKLLGWHPVPPGAYPAMWEEPSLGYYFDFTQDLDGSFSGSNNISRNPVVELFIAHQILANYQPATPLDAAYAVVEQMRSMGWKHETPAFSTYALELPPSKLQTLWALKRTGCHRSCAVVGSVLRSMGIASAHLRNGAAHSALRIELPAGPQLLFDGDNIYDVVLANLPTHHSFCTPEKILGWVANVPLEWEPWDPNCYLQWMLNKESMLVWFSYYDDPVYGEFLKTHCCSLFTWCLPKGLGCQGPLYGLFKPFKPQGYEDCPYNDEGAEWYLKDEPEIDWWLWEVLYPYFVGECPPTPWGE